MVIDVPYHYEHAPRMVQNVRVESQNNWYLGAHRMATDIQRLGPARSLEGEPEWEVLPKVDGSAYELRPVKRTAAPKAKRSVARPDNRPYCMGEPTDAKDCLVPK